MLTTPQKRFVWARSERFADFSDLSIFHVMSQRRRDRLEAPTRLNGEPSIAGTRWKPAPWTPWLWVKSDD